MPLQTNYISVDNLRQDLLYNEMETDENLVTKYRPLTIRTQGVVKTNEGAKRDLQTLVTVGTLQNQPMTVKQIYTQLGNISNMHTRLQNALKQFYIDAINEDVSV